ncbi:global nitrogen regulator NtcA [Prochlorococcus sp. MIT 1223]|uniref:global nitrogen regulator NtcA n=1 Tax=Prochlorococcus sp. MIT 1223 TaxID=3096217 RepID=UPI002A7561B5|nr:global nitrogen regulator NtcA [Prochlorococcus sp. MIT 1223]
MVTPLRGFSRSNQTKLRNHYSVNSSNVDGSLTKATLFEVIKSLEGACTEIVDRSKTIFFPGDPAERVYLIKRGAVRLSRVYESGEEITVALLRENSLFGVLSLITGHRSDRFYHAVAFTRVEMITAPATSVRKAIEEDTAVGLLLLQGLSSRILQTETMIETLTHRDMSSRLVSFLLVLCRDFGMPGEKGITIDLRLSHQAIAEAIGSTRVTITRLLGDLRNSGLLQIDRKKITVFDPIALAKRFN